MPLLVLLFLLYVGIAAWGNNAVLQKISKWRPEEPFNSEFNSSYADYYIWSDLAPRALRRRYVIMQAFFCPAGLCLALAVWQNEADPLKQELGAFLFSAVAVMAGTRLIWKCIKHGF